MSNCRFVAIDQVELSCPRPRSPETSKTASAWEFAMVYDEIVQVCDQHTGNVDAAEIEAAYENTRTILDKSNKIKIDTGSIRTSIETESNFTDDSELSLHNREILDAIAALNDKMDEVIELLKTPQGKRPDWNEKP